MHKKLLRELRVDLDMAKAHGHIRLYHNAEKDLAIIEKRFHRKKR